MKKDALELLKSKMKLLYNNSIEFTDLKTLFDYPNDYNLLFNFLELIISDINKLNVRSHYGNYRYMIQVIECIRKLMYSVDITETHPIYYKMSEVVILTEKELNKKHNKNMNCLLNKIKSGFLDIIDIINSPEYQNRHKIEAENVERMITRKKHAREITNYILFEIKDIKLIMRIKNEYFHNAIIEDMENIVKRLCFEYTYGTNAFDEYYYLLFMYLSADGSFGLDKYYEYIEKNIKGFFKNKYKSNVKFTNHNVDQKEDLLKKLANNNSDEKYGIQKPIADNDVIININKNEKAVDMRNKYVFTIDPAGSECLDDALSFEKMRNGNFLITVYIADLTDVITPSGDIDRYACNMAETIFRGKTIPMLPNIIYNNHSSLIVGAEKLVHAYTFEITPEYEIVNVRVERALINVKDNYSYGKIDDLILHNNMPFAEGLRELYSYSMDLLTKNVRRQRYLYSKEVLDPSRKDIDRFGDNPSNRIISELKVLVNSYLALNAYNMNIPFIYRNNLQNKKIDNPDFVKLFNDPEFQHIRYVLHSSFGSSYYSATSEGHYGLDLKTYAHVSTPLRNYSSLFNQRMVANYMIDEDKANVDGETLQILCDDLAKYLNKRIILNKMYAMERSNKKKILTN